MSNLDDFKSELERELIAAAYRTNSAPALASRPRGFQFTRILGAVAAVAIVAVTALGILVARPDSASAQVFRIRTIDSRTILDVIDVVEDPDEVVDQLRTEIDVDAEMFAVPVPNQLVGQIVAVVSTGDVSPATTLNELGTVQQVELANDFDGALLIEYGRPAEGSEFYIATVTDPICATLYGQPPAEVATDARALASDVRYEHIEADGNVVADVSINELPSTSGLVDIAYLNRDTIIVTFSANPVEQPERTECE